ncbi:MAG: cyclic nucleotide-gated ion channel [Beijerinckiaceae bacterium]
MSERAAALRRHRWRRRTYQILEGGTHGDRLSRVVHATLVVLVLISVTAVILESVPSLDARYGRLFLALEIAAAVVFSVEYLLRLWSAVEHPPLKRLEPWRARWQFARQPAMIVDLVAVLPIILTLLLPDDLKVLMIFRLIRFFKLGRYSPGMRSLMEAIAQERRALLACLIIICGVMIVTAAAMHMVEGTAQPEKFGSIPESMWWSIITLTTVGYGDSFPITPLGKIVAGLTALCGIVMVALPVGIIATSFAEVIRRRDFVITWEMVARAPLFQSMDSAQVADIIRVMRSEMIETGEVIARKGDDAECVYIVATGSVELVSAHSRRICNVGEMVGDACVLAGHPWDVTVRARELTRLLAIDHDDFNALAEREPALRRSMEPRTAG